MTKREGIPQIDVTKALDEVLDDTFQVVAQTSFLKIIGPNGHRVYVSMAPRCRQVDLSFVPPGDVDWKSLVEPRRKNGAVKHELDTSAESFLSDLKDVITWMRTAPAPESPSRRERHVPVLPVVAQRQAAAPEADEVDVDDLSEEEKETGPTRQEPAPAPATAKAKTKPAQPAR